MTGECAVTGRRLLMFDGCAGLQGASRAMKERGWHVVTLDIDPAFDTDIVADLRDWSWNGPQPDLMWFSPPCDEFAREFMPWSKTGKIPDMSIVHACYRIIEESKPRYWVIENVRGAIKYLGKPSAIIGPFYFWGFFPPLSNFNLVYRKKESYSSRARAERAMIPHQISLAFAQAIESQMLLPLEPGRRLLDLAAAKGG